jgi:hypothetical protein
VIAYTRILTVRVCFLLVVAGKLPDHQGSTVVQGMPRAPHREGVRGAGRGHHEGRRYGGHLYLCGHSPGQLVGPVQGREILAASPRWPALHGQLKAQLKQVGVAWHHLLHNIANGDVMF